MAHTSGDMIDSIGTPEIVDIAITGAVLLLAAAGFWRGVAKELFISASLLLGYVLTLEWAARWGTWIGDKTRFETAEGQYVAIVGTLLLLTLLIGYLGCNVAGLPPADLPGRFGGLVLGAANALFAIAILITRSEQLVLDRDQRNTLADTRVGEWLSGNFDWLMLGIAASALLVLVVSLFSRRRRSAIVSVITPPPAGSSGFKVRRGAPLAPEAEKITGSGSFGGWPDTTGMAHTVPLTRVGDPSRFTDRPAPVQPASEEIQIAFPPSQQEVIRCVSCGERITESDRFCPRCGRLLVAD
jgi:hypothetical protein